MTPRQKTILGDLLGKVLKDWPSRLVLIALTSLGGYVLAQGNHVIEEKIHETMAPVIDTLTAKQDKTDRKLDQVNQKVDALISIMVEAFPEVKKAAADRLRKKNDSKAVTDALTGVDR